MVSYSLACLNLAFGSLVYDYAPYYNILWTIPCTPILPFLLILSEAYTKLQLQFCRKEDITQWTDKYQKVKKATCSFIRTELGCETTLQSFLGLLLILFSMSSTKISETLALFDDTKNDEDYEVIAPETFLILANIWSLFSGWRSFIRGMSSSKDRFPLLSQVVLAGHVGLSMISKVVASLLFLTPSLGLFDCLRHYQGLLMPYEIVTLSAKYPGTFGSLNVSTDFTSYGNVTFPWSQLTPYDYSNASNPVKPALTTFTFFNDKEILHAFWILIAVQALLIMASKRITNAKMFKKLNCLQVITHSVENIWIPGPIQDWDHSHCTIDEYKQKRTQIDVEIGMSIFVNLVVNILMLVPVQILAYNVNKRHQFLLDTIGPLPEEIDAHWKINFMAFYMVFILIGAALLQFLFYWLYNRVFHPFQVLMTDPGTKINLYLK